MLIEFNFENFKSFKDETVLDMSADNINEYSESVVEVGKEKILPVSAIYGANASGKSNVYRAFEYMNSYVINSFKYGGDDSGSFHPILPTPFLFDDTSENKETTFEVYFTTRVKERIKFYNYGFCIGKSGITEEWLNTKAKTANEYKRVFYRDNDNLEMDGFTASSRKNVAVALEPETLVISLGAKLKIEHCKIVREWFNNNRFADFGDRYTEFFKLRTLPRDFVENADVRDKVVTYLSLFDDSIKGFEVERIPKTDNQEEKFSVYAIHEKANGKEFARIPLSSESSGTLKMFAMYQEIQDVLENGSIFLIDELNAKLHPLLVRNILLTFINPDINKNHAQIIFTSHDTWQLSNKLLRRDEIWFTEKNRYGESTLFALSDFVDDNGKKIRNDEQYENNYLIGKYGAIPDLYSFGTLGDE